MKILRNVFLAHKNIAKLVDHNNKSVKNALKMTINNIC